MNILALLTLGAALTAPADSIEAPADTAFVFTDITLVPVTPVKDQSRSGTCWCFAGTSFYENEILRNTGDTIDLSEMFTVRKCYDDKAERYVRMYGDVNFSPGGSLTDVAHVWATYGAMPEEAYSGLEYGEDKHNHGELHDALKGIVNAAAAKGNGRVSTAWRRALNGVLDAYLGAVPETFTYKGKTYTPRSFADALGIDPDNYVPVTSFTHHPFYTWFAVEVPDNWLWDKYLNVPMDEMKAIVDNALEQGYTVLWAADVSEDGFKWKEGVALMPKGQDEGDMTGTELARWTKLSDKDRRAEKYNFKAPVEEETITQESRQEMFDRQETTDDHAMEIIGIATDQKGNRYYKVKNSWNTQQVYDGYIYVSEPYFLAKTVDIYVNKAAVPAAIAKKAKLK